MIMRLGALGGPALGFAIALGAPPALAFDFDLRGSFGEKGGHKRYVPPISNPLFNETPYITTEARPIYLHNEIPSGFVTGGGQIDLGALEVRIALTDRLGFIASKDGYGRVRFKNALPDDTGFANISLGFKYAVISDPKTDTILTIGAEYEPPSGDLRAGPIKLQGDGRGFLDLFVTGAKAWGPLGLQGSMGINIALDGSHDSSMFHYSAHVDYELFPNFFPVFEVNGFTVVDRGNRTPLNFEGVDLVNFGSTKAGTVITTAFGARYRVNDHILLGAAYERAVGGREDILDWRVYFDVVLKY